MTDYYVGKDISIWFEVFKDGKPAHPVSAKVAVYDPDSQWVKSDTAKIKKSEVGYVLKGKDVEKSGKYAFVCDVLVRWLGKYTHVVKVDVKKLPGVKENGRDKPVVKRH